jgi:parallel beta-helix repeat protein
MNGLPATPRSAAIALACIAAMLVPAAARAQALLVVNPTTVSVQTPVGTNAASQTVQVSNGGNRALKWSVVPPTAGWLSVSPSKGTNAFPLTLTFATSTLPVGVYQTTFTVETGVGSSVAVAVQVSIVSQSQPPPPAQLTVTCPANMSLTSPDGSAVVVSYSVSTSGGVQPVAVNGSPASGSSFPVGMTSVQVTAKSSDGQTASCGFTVTVSYTPSGDWTFCAAENAFCAFSGTRQVRYGANGSYFFQTLSGGTPCNNSVFGDPIVGTAKHCDVSTAQASSSVGPQATITCPAGAVDVFPGTDIQATVNLYPGATTFCLRSGTHSLVSPITPKTGNTFIGEYGAIVDGTGWTTTDHTEAAFRAHNQDIDFVTIRNLVIRNLQRGIHAYYLNSDHWTIENNEIAFNQSGIVFPSNSTIRNNHIHHNSSGGYLGSFAHNSLLENNEIAYNGWEQKVGESNNVTFRNSFVHHNAGDGIWYDGNNTGSVIEGNRVEDNGQMGIFYEISSSAIIRNNTIRRSRDTAVFISTSKNVQIYDNILEGNFRGITYFVNCASVGGGAISFDLANNTAHQNTVVVGTEPDAFATVFSYTLCSPTQVAEYVNGSKNLAFSSNTYDVPSPSTGRYWFWNALKLWTEWQALGHDLTGTVK